MKKTLKYICSLLLMVGFLSCTIEQIHVNNNCNSENTFLAEFTTGGEFAADIVPISNEEAYVYSGFVFSNAFIKKIDKNGDIIKAEPRGDNGGSESKVFLKDFRLYWLTDLSNLDVINQVSMFEMTPSTLSFLNSDNGKRVSSNINGTDYLVDAIQNENGEIIIAMKTNAGFSIHKYFESISQNFAYDIALSDDIVIGLLGKLARKPQGDGYIFAFQESEPSNIINLFELNEDLSLSSTSTYTHSATVESFIIKAIDNGKIIFGINEMDKCVLTCFENSISTSNVSFSQELFNIRLFDIIQQEEEFIAVGEKADKTLWISLNEMDTIKTRTYSNGQLRAVKPTADGGFIAAGGLGQFVSIAIKMDCFGEID